MGWWITLGVLFLLAVLPVGVSVKYNTDGPLVRVILGLIRFTVFPLPKKERRKKRRKNPKRKKQTLPKRLLLRIPRLPPNPRRRNPGKKRAAAGRTFFLL